MLNKVSIDDIQVKGKRVLCRCDFNVPLIDGKITDENRLVASLPTINKLIGDGAKVILCSHLGKPKGEPKPELSLAPVAVRLSELLNKEVIFAADPEVVGPNAKAAVEAMNDGDVVLLENTRYRAEETKNGEAFSKELASLCELTVEELNEALDCAQSPMSLDSFASGDEGLPVSLAVGREDAGLNIERLSLKEALSKLPEKDGQLITLRYFRGLTQRETAKCLNMTQVQVSRREKQILQALKEHLTA